MKKPLICISSGSNRQPLTGSPIRSLTCPASYPSAIEAAGGIPLLSAEQCPEEMAELCDGLLLSGGEDMDPCWYGETVLNETVVIDSLRDRYEADLCRAFLQAEKPILAICRGFQLLNVVLGGDLWQDLTEQLGFIHSDARLRHPCHAEEGSVLQQLYGSEFRVNSTHHQAVRRLGEGLWVTARSVEGIVEGYEHRTLPILGTQFHPERMTGPWRDGRTPDFAGWFAYFIRLTRRNG